MDINDIDKPLQPLRVFILSLFIFLPPLLIFLIPRQTNPRTRAQLCRCSPICVRAAERRSSRGPGGRRAATASGEAVGGDTRYVNNCATPIGKGNKNFPG